MAKHKKDPLLVALEKGQSYTWTTPDGGDFASMRAAIKHGQTITVSPIVDPADIKVGDLVYVKWHNSYIFHLVGDIKDGRFLIVNSVGKENGWVESDDILGRSTKIVDPEPRPTVPQMLEQLEAAYSMLIKLESPSNEYAQRLMIIVNDLRWYADRLGPDRWYKLPRSNKWSFEQNLWRLTKQAKNAVKSIPNNVDYLIDCGKKCVGLASETVILLEQTS
jgi:hypothetical protein